MDLELVSKIKTFALKQAFDGIVYLSHDSQRMYFVKESSYVYKVIQHAHHPQIHPRQPHSLMFIHSQTMYVYDIDSLRFMEKVELGHDPLPLL